MSGYELEDILHSVKSFTAHEIGRIFQRMGAVWQKESYDHIVRDVEQLEAYQEYIAVNPDKARLREGEYILRRASYVLAS
jgi:hypothetical protein